MFALGIRLLMDRIVAAQWNAREKGEWPPHPDRVFMALMAAHGETEKPADEAAALRWLEQLSRPALHVCRNHYRRDVVTTYVPVNDTSEPELKGKLLAPMGSLPIGRVRQPRQFPAIVPEDPTFFLIWSEHLRLDTHRAALERLCTKVTYLGHSSSPVLMWVEDNPPAPTLIPEDGEARERLRVFGPGRYEDLSRRHADGIRPQPSLWQGYSAPDPQPARGIARSAFDDNLIILRQTDGRRFSLESTQLLVHALRDTLMSRANLHPAPEWLGGHDSEGKQSRQDHLAIMPLGFVGREHADGHLLGLALAIPRAFSDATVAELARLLEAEPEYVYIRLVLGRSGSCTLELEDREDTARPFTLRPSTWTEPSKQWATVTPVVLDRFPRRELTAETIVAAACVRAGLPQPTEVRVGRAPLLAGVPHSSSFPPLPHREGRPPRQFMHARVTFPEAVRGPVMIGAGRYLGYGVCRPLDGSTRAHTGSREEEP
jgi:CRISPR-associated protein Csb2